MNTQARNELALADLKSLGGIVAKGAWQTGKGNYKKARAVPVGATMYGAHLATSAPKNIQDWFKAHPRAQACIAVA